MLFIAKGIFDQKPFYERFPQPLPPMVTLSGGQKEMKTNDPKYVNRINHWARLKTAWMIINSLEDTPGLEWELVKKDDPDTWLKYEEEMDEILLPNEVNMLVDAVTTACALTNQKVEEATQGFLLGQEMGLLNSYSPTTEQPTTQSTEPAKDSESEDTKENAGTT